KEQIMSQKEYLYEGKNCPVFSDGELEYTAVHRKIAEKLPLYDAIVVHGAAISVGGKAYLFQAKSGTGKTTHARLWLKNVEGSEIVNGDKPIIRIIDGIPVVFGSPWNGKENYGKNTSCPLSSVCFVNRGEENSIGKISFGDAMSAFIGHTHRPENPAAMIRTINIIDKIGKSVGFYELHCNMEDEAARVSYDAMK
ncbi:MAG: hypothetical protein KBT31_05550, partial [Firmicutes bacterium]|nr:hypothetical protein [Candidatus Colimorpha enterica]